VKATAELGDISALADEISLKKKQEVFEEMYMGVRRYLTPTRTALYVLGGLAVCFGLIVAAVTWFSTEFAVAALGSAMLFCVAGAALLTFLGCTQETASRNPMPGKRAAFYAASAGVFLFGVFIVPMTYYGVRDVEVMSPDEVAAHGASFSSLTEGNLSLMTAIATLIPFVLPSVALLAFLLLTEKDRRKPWVVEYAAEYRKHEAEYFANPATATRFGLVSGAIWITAVALFIVLTMRAGFLYSWLVFVGAIVAQLLIQALFMGGKK
jgi:hypothetical protein